MVDGADVEDGVGVRACASRLSRCHIHAAASLLCFFSLLPFVVECIGAFEPVTVEQNLEGEEPSSAQLERST